MLLTVTTDDIFMLIYQIQLVMLHEYTIIGITFTLWEIFLYTIFVEIGGCFFINIFFFNRRRR